VIAFAFDVEIARPPAEVFAYVTDPSKLHEWQTNTVEVEQLTPAPFGAGTRLREVHAAGRRRMEQVVEVTAYEPGRRFDLDVVEGPLPVGARHTFDESPGGGTVIHFAAEGRAPGAMRLAEPVLQLVVRNQMKRHYARLKERLENGPAEP
jgi:ligand-binding SRPBCC domain-containing protein